MSDLIFEPEIVKKEWKPTPKQTRFIRIPHSVFEGFYGGAAGGGKSEVLLMLPIIHQWYKNGNFKAIILRRTFPELEKELILRAYEYYPAMGGAPSNGGRRWRWDSGAVIDFAHAEHENDIRKYDSAEYNYIAFDELTSFTEFQYTYLFSRCRSSDPTLPAIVRSASNPGNIGHGWVRKRFVEPCVAGNVLLVDRRTQQKRIFIPALLTDNPHLNENDPGYRWRLELLPEAERRAKLLGDWWTFSGQVFGDFRLEPLPGEPDYARHVIEPFPIPDHWPRILAVDWGFTAATWGGFGAIAPTGKIYVYKEYHERGKLISTWANEIARLAYPDEIKRFILDTNAWAQVGQPETVAQQVEREVKGFLPVPQQADKDRLGGKALIQELIRWKPKPPKKVVQEGFDREVAEKLLRNKGQEAYEKYLEWFAEEKAEVPGVDIPRLQIFKNCEGLITALPLCVYDDKRVEDVAEFDGDDPYDGFRYLAKGIQRYLKEAKREHEKVQKIEAASEYLQRTGDQTGYYRRMANAERGKRQQRSVRLYHRGRRRAG